MAKKKIISLESLILKQLKDIYTETPNIQIMDTKYGKIVNINYSGFKICIDRIYNLIGECMQVFVRLPHCDIHFSDLEDLFDIVYKSNLAMQKQLNKSKERKDNEIQKDNKEPNKTTQPKVHKVLSNS